MARLSVHAEALRAAAERIGGERALARYLRVSMPDLFAWMRAGAEPPPINVFLKAVDLLLDDADIDDQSRAQKLRIAAIRRAWGVTEPA